MNVKIIKVGSYQTNCYIVEKDNKCLIIDPGDEYKKIISNIKFEIIGILITHHHFDHVGALKHFKKVPIYDNSNLKEGKTNVGIFNFEVIYTPGHASDSLTYYFYEDNVMFTGDFLFNNDIGRTDLPTGNDTDMKKSIERIKTYNNDIVIYPGHEESTILGIEKQNNIYFNT